MRVAGGDGVILPFENKSDTQMSIMLEPTTFTVELEPGQVAEIVMPTMPDAGEFQLDYHDDQWLSVWVPTDASIRIRKD